MTDYTPPTQDEIQRVAAYWQRVKLLACQHDTGFTSHGDGGRLRCSSCEEPLNFLTDVQVEEMKRRAPLTEDVRDSLIQQLDRGGVMFAVDGQWHDVRLVAHCPDGMHSPACDHKGEYGCMSSENIQLMLRATEVR